MGTCEVDTILAPEGKEAFLDAVRTSGYNIVDDVLGSIDTANCEAFSPSDLAVIQEKINSSTSFESLDETIRSHLRLWFADQGGTHGVQVGQMSLDDESEFATGAHPPPVIVTAAGAKASTASSSGTSQV